VATKLLLLSRSPSSAKRPAASPLGCGGSRLYMDNDKNDQPLCKFGRLHWNRVLLPEKNEHSSSSIANDRFKNNDLIEGKISNIYIHFYWVLPLNTVTIQHRGIGVYRGPLVK